MYRLELILQTSNLTCRNLLLCCQLLLQVGNLLCCKLLLCDQLLL
jgi:hypothetical protein